MLTMQELNPVIRETIEMATDGLDLMEAARLRHEMLTRIETESLCGIMHADQIAAIITDVLLEDIQRLELQLKELGYDTETAG